MTFLHLQFLKDWHLMLMVLCFLVVDLIMLTAVTAINGARYVVRTIPDKEHLETTVNVRDTSSSCATVSL